MTIAVCIEAPTKYARYKVYDTIGIAKGTLLMLSSADLYALASSGAGPIPFAGIATMEKVALDGSTEISAALDGTWDLLCGFYSVPVGAGVMLSGANMVMQANTTAIISGAYVGKVLESTTSGSDEVVRVRVGSVV